MATALAFKHIIVDGTGFTTIDDGRKVVAAAGTAEPLVAVSTLIKRVVIMAEVSNTGYIVVGGEDVIAADATRTGIPLSAGASFQLEIADLASIYIDAEVNGDGCTFIYLT